MMLCILFFLTFINSENGFIITHGHRYGLFRQPYYHHHHLPYHQYYYHGFNRPFNHIRYLLHRNCTCEGGCYSCQYKRVPYYFGCGMFKMECEKEKVQEGEGPQSKGAKKLTPVQLSIDEPTKKYNTTTPTSENVSDEDYDSGSHSDSREDTIKSKEINIIASLNTTESTVSTSTASIVSTSTASPVSTSTVSTVSTSTASPVSTSTASTVSTLTASPVSTSTASTVSTSTQSTVPTSTESTISTGSTPSTSTKFTTPTTLITSSASSISVTNATTKATTQSIEKSTVTIVATTRTTYGSKKLRSH